MFQSVRRIRNIGIALLIILCVLWIRFHPFARSLIVDFVAPFLVKKKDIELRFDNKSRVPKTKIELIQENERLKEQIVHLNLRLREFRVLEHENSELRGLLELQKQPSLNYIAARIISSDPISGGRRVRVDQGAAHGVAVGQAVLAAGYLYGRILETSDQTALVLTILDPNCKLSVNILDTNIHGILFGQKREQWKVNPMCIIKYLPRDFEYKPGMKIETSTLGTIIPPNIPVGELVHNESGKITETIDNLFKVAIMKPLDLFEEINFVTIVTKDQD